MSFLSAPLTLLGLPREIRDDIYTHASIDELVWSKNNSTGATKLLNGLSLSGVSRQVREENLSNIEHLVWIGKVTKHFVTIDVDLFAVENSDVPEWMSLFDFPVGATSLVIDLNISIPSADITTPSTSFQSYVTLIDHLTTALSKCVKLSAVAVTLNIMEPEPWFVFHQLPNLLMAVETNWLMGVDCPFAMLMVKCSSLSAPVIAKDLRPDASISRYPGLLRWDDEELKTALQRCVTARKPEKVAVLQAIEKYGEHLAQADPNEGLW